MPGSALFDEINDWIPEVIAASLARDIESNLKTMLAAMSADTANASLPETALQAQVLHRMREKLGALETRLEQAGDDARR